MEKVQWKLEHGMSQEIRNKLGEIVYEVNWLNEGIFILIATNWKGSDS